MLIRPLFISAYSRAGKDTLADALRRELAFIGVPTKKVHLARSLKEDFDAECMAKFGISAFSEITREKNVIRRTLIDGSKKKRFESNGSYYFNKSWTEIEENRKQGFSSIVPDLRHMEYSADEAILAKMYGGIIITLDRPDMSPPNPEEAANFPKIKTISDIVVTSCHCEDPLKNSTKLAKEIIEKMMKNEYIKI